ncbi:hypothetical protein KKC_16215, partial [Listeria fleischmannii subsp. coloradonensis]
KARNPFSFRAARKKKSFKPDIFIEMQTFFYILFLSDFLFFFCIP